jgi:hypothetical protein
MCNFCEAYIQNVQKSHSGSKADQELIDIHVAMASNEWLKAFSILEAYDPKGDPVKLYGASSIYAILSDYVYNSVDYTLPGFMYSNADNRNDEYDKNKYNSMHLLSKSKELLFELLFDGGSRIRKNDEELIFLAFMSEIKLNRFVQASKILKSILAFGRDDIITRYALMVYLVETKNHAATRALDKILSRQELNSLYYLARYMLDNNEIETAREVLERLLGRSEMPAGVRLFAKVQQSLEEGKL